MHDGTLYSVENRLSDEKQPGLDLRVDEADDGSDPFTVQWEVLLSDVCDQDLEAFRRGCDLRDAPAYRRDYEHRPD